MNRPIHDYHTFSLTEGDRQVEVKIPVPIKKKDKERLKQILLIFIDLAVEPIEEPESESPDESP